MGRFYTFFDDLKANLPPDLLISCDELLISNNRIIGIETFLLHKEDRWLEHLLRLEYRNMDLIWNDASRIFEWELTMEEGDMEGA